MNLSKVKTDKSDAIWIMKYGLSQEVVLWRGDSKMMQENLQLTRLLNVYTKQATQLKNKLHGESVLGRDIIKSCCKIFEKAAQSAF
jgi:hypothetical protein